MVSFFPNHWGYLSFSIDIHEMQGEEICVALQTHINDVMLRRYSKARAVASGSSNGHLPDNVRPPTMDINEKRVKELSKSVEESEKKANQVSTSLQKEIQFLSRKCPCVE